VPCQVILRDHQGRRPRGGCDLKVEVTLGAGEGEGGVLEEVQVRRGPCHGFATSRSRSLGRKA
jgi:hypothetical protein